MSAAVVTAPVAASERPVWLVPVRLIERVTLVVVACALVTGAVTEDRLSWAHLAYLLSAAGVVLSHRWRLRGLLLVAAAPVLAVELGVEPIALWTVVTFQAFVVALRGAPAVRTAAIGALANSTAQWLVLGALTQEGLISPSVAAVSAVASAAAGSALREHHRYWLALEQRTRDAEAGRELAARRGVAEERLRIARDLHDSVGHAVAVVSMRLGAAEVQLPPGSEAARAELHAARTGVQGVLREMQEILAVLRVGGEADPVAPTPTASRVPELVATFRRAGLDIDAELSALDRPLPADVGAAAYRIVQEALTNAGKHGSGAVRLVVGVGSDAVRIEVENRVAASDRSSGGPARPGDAPGGGLGLVGMRERAAAAGGRLEASTSAGRFVLHAELPVRGGGAR